MAGKKRSGAGPAWSPAFWQHGVVRVRGSNRGAECEARYLPAMELVDAGSVPGRVHVYSALSNLQTWSCQSQAGEKGCGPGKWLAWRERDVGGRGGG